APPTARNVGGAAMNWDFRYWLSLDEAQQAAFLASQDDALLSGRQWQKTAITYSFASGVTGAEYLPYLPEGERLVCSPLDPQEAANVRFLFSYLESFLNLDFQEVRGSSDIIIGQHNMVVGGYADLPGGPSPSGMFLADDVRSDGFGDFAYNALTHEIGHLLGLDHARAYDGGRRPNPELSVQYDTTLMSVMTYSDIVDTAAEKYVG